jgi:hypothetical protein
MALLFFSLFLLVGETTCGGFETLGGDKTHCFISRLWLVGGWLPSLTFWIEFKFQHFLMCVVIFFVLFSLSISPFLAQSSFFYLYVFFSLVGWINAMRESRSSIAGVLKESQKCLWFPPSLYVFCSSSSVSRDPPWLVVFLWLL